ncbi:MAG: hypothetical protein WCK43_06010, partial [bacterium]
METELRLLNKHSNDPHPNQSQILAAFDFEIENTGVHTADEVSFSELSTDTKQKKLQTVTELRGANFNRARNFPGLKLRNPMPLKWNKPTRFLGKMYSPHETHMVDISPLLYLPKVEYGEPAETKRVGLLEVHFSSNTLSPPELRDESWTMLEGAGILKSQAHLHVIGAPSTSTSWLIRAEFWRRLNLAAETISIVDKGFTLKNLSQNGETSMRILDRYSLSNGALNLKYISRGEKVPDEDRFKPFFVGMHLPGKYKDPRAMGFQFRTLDKERAAQFEPLIDASTHFLSSEEAGIDENRMNKWLAYMKAKSNVQRREEDYLAMTHYNAPVQNLMRDANIEIINFFKGKDPLLQKLTQESEENIGLRMLLHDFSNDPLFFDEPSFLREVSNAQIKAL